MYLFQSSLSSDILQKLNTIRPDIAINVLKTFSEPTDDKLILAYNKPDNLGGIILDSGTFTLNNPQAKTPTFVTKELYKKFLDKHINKFNWCFNFDEYHGNNGTETNVSNQLYYEFYGLNVIPVIHNLDAEVDYYCKNSKKYPLVAIGSMKKKTINKVKAAVKLLYEHQVAVHLFSVGSFAKMYDMPVYSSDSTSYLQWSNLRRMCFFDLNYTKSKNEFNYRECRLTLDSYNKSGTKNIDYYKSNPKHKEYENWLNDNLRLSINDLQNPYNLLVANSYYYWCLEMLITGLHKDKKYDFSFLPDKYRFT